MNEVNTSRTTGRTRREGGRRTSGRDRRRRTEQNRMLHHHYLTLLLVLAVVLVMILGLFTRDRSFSDAENRALAQRPSFRISALADGSLYEELESWYNDQFPGRDTWITLNLWETKRTGQRVISDVYLGKSGQLLAAPETPDDEALAATEQAINTFAQNHRDLNTYLMLVPGAAAVQSDRLPSGAPVRDQLADVKAVEQSMGSNVTVLPVANTLLAHADEEIYYKTDHHWTSLGAYYVWLEACQNMGLQGHSWQVYPVTTEFEGTLASRSGSHQVQDTIEIYVDESSDLLYYVTTDEESGKVCSVYHREALDTKDKYMVFFNGNHPKVEISTTANNGRTLLVFKDSYANAFVPFLLEDFEQIIMIDPRYYYGSLDTVLSAGVTDVLFLYSADTLVRDTSLVDVLEAEGN